MVTNEEQLNPQVTEESRQEAQVTPNSEEMIKNYESLVKQQQEQINQLIKQQELNQKVNKQLGDALKQQMHQEQIVETPKQHWVEDVINNDFVFKAQDNYINETLPAGQLATWYTKYLKEREGLSNDETGLRMKSLFDFLETGKQDVQNPPSEHDKGRPIPHEIKYR